MTNGAAALFMLKAYRHTTIYFGDTPLGAAVRHEGVDLVVMEDPEGNEFCVE